ncbi:hypothetical protein ACLVWU_18000 [Bdellovibrio sp. HCB290]|uniref:hypothetical protein n=1 Tax=Bdellovibrio sp. HCB290 TaxID=3394356 RepID=UPI0039B3C75D
MKMFKTITKSVCILSISMSPAYSLATSGVDGTSSSTTKSAQPAVNSSANDAAKSNKKGEAFNAVASATEFGIAAINWSRCSSDDKSACAVAAAFTAMAILSMKQAKENGNKAAQSMYTGDLSDAYGSNGNYNSSVANDPEYKSVAAVGSDYMKKAEAGLSDLKAKGLVNSSATKITSPDGSTYNVSDMSSPAGMAAAGLPQGAIDSAMAGSAQVEKKALEKVKIGSTTAVNGYEEGGGGGSRSPSNSESSGSGGYSGYAGAGSGGSSSLLDKDPSRLAAGMSKNYNGEPIGVAADSIFLMMSRRYKVKESQDSFFGAADIDLKK